MLVAKAITAANVSADDRAHQRATLKVVIHRTLACIHDERAHRSSALPATRMNSRASLRERHRETMTIADFHTSRSALKGRTTNAHSSAQLAGTSRRE